MLDFRGLHQRKPHDFEEFCEWCYRYGSDEENDRAQRRIPSPTSDARRGGRGREATLGVAGLPQDLRRLRHVDRNPPCLVFWSAV
jgi:hypothetical protein